MNEPSEFVDSMRRTAATMGGIDNSWNLLHIASQLMPVMLEQRLKGLIMSAALPEAAEDALRGADVLLKAWRKSQGDDYGD